MGWRWTRRRKAELLRAIDTGEITQAEAARRFALSLEELQHWRILVASFGDLGLRTLETQHYRALLRHNAGRP